MLEKQTSFFPFAKGVDSKTDPKSLVPGQLVTCQNAQFTTGNMMRKRNGTSAPIGGSAIPGGAGKWMGTLGTELLTHNGNALYSWSPGLSAWEQRGVFQTALVTRTIGARASATGSPFPLMASVYSVTNAQIEFTAYSMRGDSNVYWTVKDSATEGTIGFNYSFATTGVPLLFGVVQIGGYIVVIWYTSAQGVNYSAFLASAPFTVSSTAQISASYAGPGPIVTNANFPNYAFGAFATSASNILIYKLTSALALTTVNLTTSAHPYGIGVIVDGGNGGCVVGFSYLSTTYQLAYAGYTSVLGVSWGITNAGNTGNASDATVGFTGTSSNASGLAFWSVQAAASVAPATSIYPMYVTQYAFTGSSATTPITSRGYAFVSAPFTVGSYLYVMAANSGGSTSTAYQSGAMYFLLNLSLGTIVARIAQEDGGLIWFLETSGGFNPPAGQVSLPSATTLKLPIWIRQGPSPFTNAAFDMATVDLKNSTQGWQSAVLGKSLFFSGGLLWEYDGQTLAEQGFHYPPFIVSATVTAGGGSLSAGLYQYAVTYEWIDASGATHRSAPALVTVTATASCTVTLLITTLRNTYKQNVTIAIYRSQVNQSVLTYALQTAISNNAAVDVITYADTASDASILAQPPLYTQSGVYDMPCPPCGALTVFKNRVMAISTEYPNEIWYSKQLVIGPGSPQAVEFSDLFYQSLDGLDGNAQALGVLDDKLMIGKPDTWYYMTGSGPAPDGSNNDFSTPVVVNQSSGCSNPSSIITTSDGMFYQSTKGVFLISRGLAENYLGKELESLFDWTTNPVTSAILAPNTTQVRFSTGAGNTLLVYDYHYRQWSTWSSGSGVMTIQDQAIWNGNWVGLTPSGNVYQETPGVYLDAGTTAFQLKVLTSWLKVAGAEGSQRVYRMQILGDFKSTSTLTVTLARDYVTAPYQTDSITAATPFQFQVFPSIQKCQAIQVGLSDTGTTGESFDLNALGFYFAVKRGLFKLPSGQAYG